MTNAGQHRPADTAAGGEIPTLIIVMVGVLTMTLIIAVTTLTIYDKPVDNVLVIVGAFIAPTVTSLLGARKLSAVAKTTRETRDEVRTKVDSLITDKALLEHQLTSSGEIPKTLPARRVTDTNPYIEMDKQSGR